MSETRHTVDPKFVIPRQGKQMVLYVGLLDAAHRAGMASMSTEILQYPHAENDQTCIVRAEVTMEVGAGGRKHSFTGIGDANPRNVGANIAPHFIRMAETRAKARALRDALNVGMVTIEELGGDEDAAPQHATPPREQSRRSDPPTNLRPAVAPTAAAGTPYTKEEYEAAIKVAWQMQEAGDTYPAIVAYMRTHRDRLTPDQLEDSREEVRLIKAAIYPEVLAPASIAG